MQSPFFTEAILEVFNDANYRLNKDNFPFEPIDTDIYRNLTINNVHNVFSRLRDILYNAINQIKSGNIALADLRRLRLEFYEARKHFFLLEDKERQDVREMEQNTSWHERSKLVRIFVSSEAGEQLDREKEEAKEVGNIAQRFSDNLKELEGVIDNHILKTGESQIPSFQQTMRLWRITGQLQNNTNLAKDKIRRAYSQLSHNSCRSCGQSIAWSMQGARGHLSSADKQLNDQLNLLMPWYDQLSNEIDSTIDDVREKLLIGTL